MPGLFIQKQAEAVSSFCDVAVLYVHADVHVLKGYETVGSYENGVRVVRVYYPESTVPLLSGFLKIYRFYRAHLIGLNALNSFHPDLIHIHVLTREGLFAWINKKLKGTPYVITEHWSRYLPASNAFHGLLRKMITRRVVKAASAMIAVSEVLKEAMVDFRLLNNNFKVIPNPVETDLFVIGQYRVNTVKRFIHVSCFEDRPKNISGFLNAVKHLSALRSDFECSLIGDGPEFELWKNRAEELCLLGKNVFFTGLKEKGELVKEIQASDFMVLSSNYETFGTVVIECLACGIPVVATNVGIVSEVINNSNGIIVPVGDNKLLEDAINIMLDKSNSYVPQVIRNSVLNKFASQSVATQLLNIYSQVLNKNQQIKT